ncbi:MAG: translation initiation factor IF-3 [Puniceicoccales bacterium]|jgi:translation initiation factor IF-3|nr:translation initiation factor IF-3 [Puniceicoccales bacterium]
MTISFPAKFPQKDKRHDRRRSSDRGPRCNERIRVPEVSVIGYNGEQLGVMDTRKAVTLAKSQGLDLVEVAANLTPPVCKILDYGKYKYDEEKKSKRHQKPNITKFKEVKFRPNVDLGDYSTKIRHGAEFLVKGMRLKLSLMFRGREMAHQEIGFDVMQRAINDLQEFGILETPPKLAGRTIMAGMSPRNNRAQKRKPESEDAEDMPMDDFEI